ncbi:MAG: ABC transporter ATP-binding protein [Wenzhouxiangellaceae bacterium]
MIEVKAIKKTFKVSKKNKKDKNKVDPREQGKEFHALKGVSFTIPPGKIVGLLGSNGAGKTTLMRILATSIKPTSGTATIQGEDIVDQPLKVRSNIGFLSGNIGLYGRLSPTEMALFFGSMYGIPKQDLDRRITEIFDDLGISSFAHRRCDLLSTGMKQRVSIARSLLHSPSVIIFDEPTTGLDVSTAQGILNYIVRCKNEGKSIIFSTHHMHEVEKLCDETIILRQGEVCFKGTVEEMYQESGKNHLDDAYLALTGEKFNSVGHSAK